MCARVCFSMSAWLSICLCVYLSICLFVCLHVCVSVCLCSGQGIGVKVRQGEQLYHFLGITTCYIQPAWNGVTAVESRYITEYLPVAITTILQRQSS